MRRIFFTLIAAFALALGLTASAHAADEWNGPFADGGLPLAHERTAFATWGDAAPYGASGSISVSISWDDNFEFTHVGAFAEDMATSDGWCTAAQIRYHVAGDSAWHYRTSENDCYAPYGDWSGWYIAKAGLQVKDVQARACASGDDGTLYTSRCSSWS
ncbi:hypothetical protein [Streptomyces hoynatensis]|uniref:Secreted protein n=1 Tax=Streptomyces hoynatensis TaxID=1141874 RepID=A0A3A9YQX7_9ACTN|nr:hypothetical protein [Streptomyces hoynatensis]RKN38491.1 hypothetical protein D7294_23705 [Streptomyces hoynatensis]